MSGIAALVPMDSSITPDMTINSMGNFIDFTAPAWTLALQAFAQVSNKTAREAALAAAPAQGSVDVNPEWWKAQAKTWSGLDAPKMQSFIIGSRGTVQGVKCAKLCAKGSTGMPFKECIVIPGHFDNACANCQVRNWRSMCDHNPKSKIAQSSLPLRAKVTSKSARRAAREAMVDEASAAQQSDDDSEGEPANAVVRQGLAGEAVEQSSNRSKRKRSGGKAQQPYIVTGLEGGTPPPRAAPGTAYQRPPLFGYTQAEVNAMEAEWAEEQARREQFPDGVRLKIEAEEDNDPGLRLIHPMGVGSLTFPKRTREIGSDRIVDHQPVTPPPAPSAEGERVARLTASMSAASVSSGEALSPEHVARLWQRQAQQEAELEKTRAKLQRYYERQAREEDQGDQGDQEDDEEDDDPHGIYRADTPANR